MTDEFIPSNVDQVDNSILSVRHMAGFWRRLFAFVIDVIITSVPCFIIGLLCSGYSSISRSFAGLTGFILTLAYFGVMASDEFEGQTIGHRLLGIEVIDREGNFLPVKKSFLKYAILLVPLLFTTFFLPFLPALVFQYLGFATSFLTFVFFYLCVFNRRTRQSLHDVLTNSFVVEDGGTGRVSVPGLWTGHWKALSGIALVAFVCILPPVQNLIMGSGVFSELFLIQRAIVESGKADSANIVLQTNGSRTGLNVTVPGTRGQDYDKDAADIAEIVLKVDPKMMERDYLTIVITEGFEVGFARSSTQHPVSHTPEEWQELLQKSAAGKT